MEKSCAQASKQRVRYSRHEVLRQRALRKGGNDATPERAEHQTCPAIRHLIVLANTQAETDTM